MFNDVLRAKQKFLRTSGVGENIGRIEEVCNAGKRCMIVIYNIY